jgi:hypothetical protein
VTSAAAAVVAAAAAPPLPMTSATTTSLSKGGDEAGSRRGGRDPRRDPVSGVLDVARGYACVSFLVSFAPHALRSVRHPHPRLRRESRWVRSQAGVAMGPVSGGSRDGSGLR